MLTRDGYLHVYALPDGGLPHPGAGASAAPAIVSLPPATAGGGAPAPASGAAAAPVVLVPITPAAAMPISGANDTGTHPEVLHAIVRWSTDRAAAGAGVGAAASSSSVDQQQVQQQILANSSGGGGGPVPLPPPALPAGLIQLCASYAANVADVAGIPDLSASARACADNPASASYTLTPHTRVEALPSLHAHAFELSDKSGWLGLGSTKLVLRGLSTGDVAEWRAAVSALVEQAGVLQDAGR